MDRIIFTFFVLTGPSLAAEFQTPDGCDAFLTVQNRGCEVSVYYRCSADPAGHQWREDFGINGKTYEALIDAEGRWLQSKSFASGVSKVLTGEEPDRASLSGLLSTGYDSMEFEQTDSEGVIHHYKGYDKLTGETAVIDNVPLKRTEFSFTETDDTGNFVRTVTGNEYVSDEFARFFGGRYVVEEADGERYPVDGSPMDFILPGETGFGSTIPLYECRDMMSSLETPMEGFGHDKV